MSSEYNKDLHIPPKNERFRIIFFSRMKKKELSFIFENNGSLTNKRDKLMKRHNRNITCQCKRTLGHYPGKCHVCCTFCLSVWVGDVVFGADY